MQDMELLRDYALNRSEPAFAALVERHVGLVYSAAMRQLHDAHLAEDVTQAVFVTLARKAGHLSDRTILSGWLLIATRYTANAQIRTGIRRSRREQEAYMRCSLNEPSSAVWEQLAPLLDAGMASLGDVDRNVIAQRFFENKTAPEIADSLRLSEAATKKRIVRALDKLQRFFVKRGVDSTTSAIAGAISAHSVHAAPVTLANLVTAAALAKGTAASASTLTLIQGALKIMAWTKTKTAVVAGAVILLAAGVTTTIAVSNHERKIENDRKIEKLWRINKDLAPEQIDRLPPLLSVLPTKFGPPWSNRNSGSHGDKFAGARASLKSMAAYAYGFPQGRIRFAAAEPTNLFDFVATLPQGNQEALRRELEKIFGFVGHTETESADVLLLQIRRADSPGLRPPIMGKNDDYWARGVFHSSDEEIESGAPRFDGLVHYLEAYFKRPVIDQTGLTQHFAIELRWKELPGHPNPDGLKEVLLDRLGFELVPTNMPVEYLVMDKVH
jgi:uncharacterized protein (TIGR03435 family)